MVAFMYHYSSLKPYNASLCFLVPDFPLCHLLWKWKIDMWTKKVFSLPDKIWSLQFISNILQSEFSKENNIQEFPYVCGKSLDLILRYMHVLKESDFSIIIIVLVFLVLPHCKFRKNPSVVSKYIWFFENVHAF